jgi:hypothetical protein
MASGVSSRWGIRVRVQRSWMSVRTFISAVGNGTKVWRTSISPVSHCEVWQWELSCIGAFGESLGELGE